VGFNGGSASDHLVAFVRAINRAYLHIELVIHSSRRNSQVIRMMEKQDLDIGLVGGPVKGKSLNWRTSGPANSVFCYPPTTHWPA
jgi:DNA-binding transcriptional LysR family regulator